MVVTTTDAAEALVPAVVSRFLERIGTGEWDGMEDDLTEDVLYDASVPGWHYRYEGAARVAREYREDWSGRYRWTVVDRNVTRADDVVVVDMEAHGRAVDAPGDESRGVVVRMANFFRLDGGRIAEHRFYCCGEWDAETVRHIREHAPRVDRPARPPA